MGHFGVSTFHSSFRQLVLSVGVFTSIIVSALAMACSTGPRADTGYIDRAADANPRVIKQADLRRVLKGLLDLRNPRGPNSSWYFPRVIRSLAYHEELLLVSVPEDFDPEPEAHGCPPRSYSIIEASLVSSSTELLDSIILNMPENARPRGILAIDSLEREGDDLRVKLWVMKVDVVDGKMLRVRMPMRKYLCTLRETDGRTALWSVQEAVE